MATRIRAQGVSREAESREGQAVKGIAPPRRAGERAGGARIDPPVAAALGGNFFLRVGNAATGVMLTLYLAFINDTEYHISPLVVGLLSTAFYATELVLAPLMGAESDRRGRRWFLLVGPLLGLAAVQLTAATTILWVLFITRLLEGLSSASSIPAILSFLSARTEHDRVIRGRVMALFEASTALAFLGGLVMGTLLWGSLGRWAFVVLAAPYLVSAYLFARVRDEPHELGPQRDLHASALALLRLPAIWRFLPAWLAVNSVTGLWMTHAVYQLRIDVDLPSQYLPGRFNGDTSGLALALATYAILFAGGALAWGNAFRRFTETAIMRIALVGFFIACAGAWLVNHSGDSALLRGIALLVFAVGIVIESGFLPAAVGYLARLSGLIATDRGLFMGLYSVVMGAGSLLGGALGAPFAGGRIPLIPGSIDGVIALTVILGIVSLFVVLNLGDGLPDESVELDDEPEPRAA